MFLFLLFFSPHTVIADSILDLLPFWTNCLRDCHETHPPLYYTHALCLIAEERPRSPWQPLLPHLGHASPPYPLGLWQAQSWRPQRDTAALVLRSRPMQEHQSKPFRWFYFTFEPKSKITRLLILLSVNNWSSYFTLNGKSKITRCSILLSYPYSKRSK